MNWYRNKKLITNVLWRGVFADNFHVPNFPNLTFDHMATTAPSKQLLKTLTQTEFEHYVAPHLPFKISGRPPKLPLYRVYNYIAKVLRTGMQWSELQDFISKGADGKAEIHYTAVWKRYNQWSIFRVFERSFQSILVAALEQEAIDLSVVNGDGTNTVAKKGAMPAPTLDISTNREANA